MSIPLPPRIEKSNVVDVGVHASAKPPSGRGIRGHSLDLDEDDIRLWNGMAVTSPETTWCSLGAHLTLPELVAAGDFLVHHRNPVSSTDALRRTISQWAGKRGVRKLRDAVELLNERSESPKESELRVIVARAGFPGLEANYPIRTSGGFNYRGDLAFPSRKLIIEYQSAFHEIPESFRADMTRVSRLEADDWKVMQINKDDLHAPDELVARIGRALSSRPYF